MASEQKAEQAQDKPREPAKQTAKRRKYPPMEQFLTDLEKKKGPIPAKVKEVFRARCGSRKDFEAVWAELWRGK
ncbi:MAG TPA: hypothetical protein DEA96_09705 [Leptospiraceae bacterium]|jgi:hypothetical protein|nr:hypothetical protein [Spirochaetaceae bacterium]MBU43327.1 hypothetical protein [Spirochaetaceae bacterium]HBS05229.1 hypothetical protein [Leptospiraceae bacterium]|tara:strand:- start:25785 stop:26006 length:222 start_codon:yes stop_codon:yes gene_type:complete